MKNIIGKLVVYFSVNSRSDVINDISSFIDDEKEELGDEDDMLTFSRIERFVEKYCDKTDDGTKCE